MRILNANEIFLVAGGWDEMNEYGYWKYLNSLPVNERDAIIKQNRISDATLAGVGVGMLSTMYLCASSTHSVPVIGLGVLLGGYIGGSIGNYLATSA